MTKISTEHAKREAIIRYKLAARSYRRSMTGWPHPSVARASYSELESARSSMLSALGYDRQYGYLGEFCNLHERDFPNMIRCKPDHEGLYRHHGFSSRITETAHVAAMREARKRALDLARKVCLPSIQRFLQGWHACFDDGEAAAYVDGKLLRFQASEFLSVSPVETKAANALDAAQYFAAKHASGVRVYWQELMPFDIEAALKLAAQS